MKLNLKAALLVAAASVAATMVAPLAAQAARLRSGSSIITTVASGTSPDAPIDNFHLSSDGTWGIFSSDATNLVADDTNDATDVFAVNMSSGAITRISVYPDGTEGLYGNSSQLPSICGNGRYVAFQTMEDFDIESDYNSAQDIYWVDRDADADGTYDEHSQDGAVTISRASIGTNFDEVYDSAQNASISQDCSWITYDTSDLLESNDINSEIDVYAHSVSAGTNVLISASQAVSGAGGGGELAVVSSTGRFVAFRATGSDLVDASGGKTGYVLVDRDADEDGTFDEATAGAVTREYISKNTAGTVSNGTTDGSAPAAMSPDGNCVAFKMTNGNDLDDSVVATNAIYMRDRAAGTTAVVSINDGLSATEASNPAVSSDCRFVTFDSGDADFVLGDSNAKRDVFIHDMELDYTAMVTNSSDETGSTDDSFNALVFPLTSGEVPVYVLSKSNIAGSTGTYSYAVPVKVNVSDVVAHTNAVRAGTGTAGLANGAFVTTAVLNVAHDASGIVGESTLVIEKTVATAKAAAGSWTSVKSTTASPVAGVFARQSQSNLAIAAGQTICLRGKVTAGSLVDSTASTCVARPLDLTSSLIARSTGATSWTKIGNGASYKSQTLNSVLTMSNITGRKFVLVANKCKTCGSVQVKLGTKTVTISLQSNATVNNAVIPVNFTGVTSNISGTLTVKVTTSNKWVTIAGIGIARY